MESNGKEVMNISKSHPSEAKLAKVGRRGAKKRGNIQVEPSAWLPTPMLDRTPLLANASIKDFQGGKGGYMADAVEQALCSSGAWPSYGP